MENCWANLGGLFKKKTPKPPRMKTGVVLKDPTGREIGLRYELGRELGRGEFGVTYLCKDKQTGQELACKSISKKRLRKASDIEDLRRQVEIMNHLPQHPNIVSLKYTYEDENDVHLVSELCEGGNLLDHIVARGRYTQSSAASVIKTIVKLVQMCHKHGVMLRNLTLENFLFADKTETASLKVIDFHLSIFFQPGERLNQKVGNLYYMAPEELKKNYGPEIDIWSAGVILYTLLCGVPPFWAETVEGFTQAIIQSDIEFKTELWAYVSDGAQDLVKKMLDPDPMRRLSAQQVLAHPWLIEHAKKKSEQDLINKPYGRKNLMEIITEQEKLAPPWLLNAKTAANVSSRETIRAKLLQYSIMNHLAKATSMYALAAEHYYVEYGDVLDLCIELRKISHEEHVDRAFHFFDKKQSGYIELEELRKALAVEIDNKEVINAIMQCLDTIKDGRVSYEEITNRSFKLMNEWSSELINDCFTL